MKKMQGFTLIELMIVVAIIAILAAIAISQYQDYVIRSQVSEGSALADGVKTAMAEFQQNSGKFPPTNLSAGLAKNTSIVGSYVSQVDVGTVTGQVTVTFGNKANTKISGSTLIFSAIKHEGSIEWDCKNHGTVLAKYKPASCRT